MLLASHSPALLFPGSMPEVLLTASCPDVYLLHQTDSPTFFLFLDPKGSKRENYKTRFLPDNTFSGGQFCQNPLSRSSSLNVPSDIKVTHIPFFFVSLMGEESRDYSW